MQLISYIAPGAPATRRPAAGNEPFLRPEIGFTPKWYRQRLGIDFGERWHTDPASRRESVVAMRAELGLSFPGLGIGGEGLIDLLTGVFGALTVAGIYGVPIRYAADGWPVAEHAYLSDDKADRLEPPVLDDNALFRALLAQMDWIAEHADGVRGYVNWQSPVNTAHRLRGPELFTDLVVAPERAHRLFDCVCTTMIETAECVHARQRASGFEVPFFTVSNCLVNMLSPEQYREFLLPLDQRIAERFGCIGVHNCAWNANPYLDAYAAIPNVGYIDMGLASNLARARELFPDVRRALMYTPMDLANKPLEEIRADLECVADEYGPCDIVAADIEADTPDQRVRDFVALCAQISESWPVS